MWVLLELLKVWFEHPLVSVKDLKHQTVNVMIMIVMHNMLYLDFCDIEWDCCSVISTLFHDLLVISLSTLGGGGGGCEEELLGSIPPFLKILRHL